MQHEHDLFAYKAAQQTKHEAPLADRLRPDTLDAFVGQRDVIGEGSVLRQLIEQDDVPSMIFWGPPGTGKTTLARIIAGMTESRFVQLSAVSSGVAELRETVTETQERRRLYGTRTIVFVDEIHRWNKAQQDAFLPFVEDGTLTLIGATTENPSFEINAALLSRCRVFVLQRLDDEDVGALLARAIEDTKNGFPGKRIDVEPGVLEMIASIADGDARTALNTLEIAVKSSSEKAVGKKDGSTEKVIRLQKAVIAKTLRRSHLLYDKKGEGHYNIISALHKSMRGSDADASLYWLCRMLEAGEDPLYIARRLVRFASEDIGLADPDALVQATAAFQAAHQLGMPECNVCLAQAVVYMARAPKSNALYAGYGKARSDVANAPNEPVPVHLRNAPTKLMQELGYGANYVYPPDASEPVHQEYLPEKLHGRKYLPSAK